MTAEQALQAVCSAVEACASGWDVWVGRADPVADSGLSIVVVPVSDEPVAVADYMDEDDALTGTRTARYQLVARGAGGLAALQRVTRRLVSHTGEQAALAAAGVTVLRTTGPSDVSVMYQSATMPQHSADLVCQYVWTDTPAAVDDAAGVVVDVDAGGAVDVTLSPAAVQPDP